MPGGFVGVDIFFVISGFLISSILFKEFDTGVFSIKAFYARRIRRIFPALLLILLTALLVGWFIFLPQDYEELSWEVVSGGLFSSNILFWRESGYFDSAAETKPLLHLWSLGVEEQFYIFWPILVYIANKFRWQRLCAVLIVASVSMAINLVASVYSPIADFYLPFSRLWELALGGALAASVEQIHVLNTPRRRDAISLIGAFLIFISLFALNPHVAYPGWRALLPVCGAVLLIAARGGIVNRLVLEHRWMVSIGLISYPLYLWHWLFLAWMRSYADIDVLNKTAILQAIALSFVAAILTYYCLEKPIRNAKGRVRVTCWLVIVAILVIAAGIVGRGTHGLPPSIQFLGKKVDHQMMESYWRSKDCFFIEPNNNFSDICVDAEPKGAPLVAIWGDSNGAALYPGLRTLQKERRFRIAQFTMASCPPILDFDDTARFNEAKTFCATSNRKTLALLGSLKPDVLILEAFWPHYSWADPWPENLERLEKTVAALRRSGLKRIIIITSMPVWKEDIQGTLYYIWIHDPLHALPLRTKLRLADTSKLDENLQQIAVRQGIEILSPREFLCNEEGCLTRLGDTVDDLMTWDDSHLTPKSSDYFASLIADRILGNSVGKRVPAP